MSLELNSAFERREEWKAAHLSDLEYREIARTLKSLAAERGAPADPVIDALAHKGLGAALGVIEEAVGEAVQTQFQQYRARQQLG